MQGLTWLRVVEVSRGVAAAACGGELARWGALVELVEAEGSPLHRAPPTVPAAADGASLLRASLHWGKTVHAGPVAGPDADWRAWLPAADLLITDLPLADLNRADLAAQFPQLIIIHFSPFGPDGPYADYLGNDLIVQALGGFAGANGLAGRPPLAAPAAIVPRAVGVLGAVAGLAALLARARSGLGEWIDVAEQAAVGTLIMALRAEFSGEAAPRVGGSPGWARVLAAQDGFLTISPWSKEILRNAAIAFGGEPPTALLEGEGRFAEREASLAYIQPIVEAHSAEEVWTRLAELGCVLARHRTPSQLLDDPQLQALDFFTDRGSSPAGDGRRLRGAGNVMRVTEQPAPPDAVLSPTFAERPPPAEPSGPLDGLRVVDFTHAWLGPYASLLLAQLGAEVIKVEGPQRPDLWRYDAGGPMRAAAPDAHPLNVRANFNMVNIGKRSVSLALDTAAGRQLALDLIARSDVVLENFRPRVLQNLRLTHADLRAVNPRAALVSFSGFGTGGPYDNFRANGGTTEGSAGWDLLLGYAGEAPLMLGTMQADPIIGAQMAAAALAAVLRSQRERAAVHVEGSMFASATAYIDEYLLAASLGMELPPRSGNRRPEQSPHECFRCADAADGSEQWIAIAAPDDEVWSRLAAAAGIERDAWQTLAGRKAAEDELEAALGEWTKQWDPQTLQHRLQQLGIPAGKVHSTLSHLRDPHLQAVGWWQYLAHPDTGVRQYPGAPWTLARQAVGVQRPAPRLGEHTEEVLRDVLQRSRAELAQYEAKGVTAHLQTQPRAGEAAGPISPR